MSPNRGRASGGRQEVRRPGMMLWEKGLSPVPHNPDVLRW
jgi:hypothetical protein